MSTLNGSSLFAGIYSGLTSTYSLISNAYSNQVTPTNIAAAMSNTSLTSSLNQTFASYIQTNFSSLDTDKNGVLSSAELSNLTNQISSQGLTAAQLTQLGAASGLSGDALSQVLEHFSDIDTNGDGKVTTAEISAYKLTSAMEKKKTEFANRAATNMSVFYGDDTSNSANSSSLLDYKYMNSGSSDSSSNS
ncbi:MAG: EF-hand domain-containing protein [Candidatus Gastranaerophilaceae bacterium]